MEYSLASCRSVCDWAKQCLYHLTCRTGGWSVTWKRTNFSVALLPLGVGGTNVLAGIVLILWVWLPGSFCGCGFLAHSVGVASGLILWVWLPVCQYCLSPSQVVCTNGDSAVYSRCVAYVWHGTDGPPPDCGELSPHMLFCLRQKCGLMFSPQGLYQTLPWLQWAWLS